MQSQQKAIIQNIIQTIVLNRAKRQEDNKQEAVNDLPPCPICHRVTCNHPENKVTRESLLMEGVEYLREKEPQLAAMIDQEQRAKHGTH